MAAYFKFKNYGKDWHINQKPPSKEEIKDLESVTIDDNEAEIIYGLNFTLIGSRVHTLLPNESKLYALLVLEKYSNCKSPIVTEKGLLTLLKGDSNSRQN